MKTMKEVAAMIEKEWRLMNGDAEAAIGALQTMHGIVDEIRRTSGLRNVVNQGRVLDLHATAAQEKTAKALDAAACAIRAAIATIGTAEAHLSDALCAAMEGDPITL